MLYRTRSSGLRLGPMSKNRLSTPTSTSALGIPTSENWGYLTPVSFLEMRTIPSSVRGQHRERRDPEDPSVALRSPIVEPRRVTMPDAPDPGSVSAHQSSDRPRSDG